MLHQGGLRVSVCVCVHGRGRGTWLAMPEWSIVVPSCLRRCARSLRAPLCPCTPTLLWSGPPGLQRLWRCALPRALPGAVCQPLVWKPRRCCLCSPGSCWVTGAKGAGDELPRGPPISVRPHERKSNTSLWSPYWCLAKFGCRICVVVAAAGAASVWDRRQTERKVDRAACGMFGAGGHHSQAHGSVPGLAYQPLGVDQHAWACF